MLISITFLSFLMANISTIDPAEAFLRRKNVNISERNIQELREKMGLNKSLHKQYFAWVSKSIKGDFGKSLTTGNEVSMEIIKRIPATLKLIGISLIMIIISIPIGVLCVIYKDSFFDGLTRVITIIGISIPEFWLGFMLLYIFAVKLKIVPVVSHGEMKNIVLPAITLSSGIIACNTRFLIANMLENMNMDYITYARARGISNRRIIWIHILKKSLPPIVTLFAQNIGYMMAGTVIVENVFSWPGLGNFSIKAILARDLPFISAYVLLIAIVFILANFLSDVINMLINPEFMKESGDW